MSIAAQAIGLPMLKNRCAGIDQILCGASAMKPRVGWYGAEVMEDYKFRGHDSRSKATTDVWLTPPSIIRALGEFDLDPCFSAPRPWATAKHHFGEDDDGLSKEWHGRVWMNPPYGALMGRFMAKLAAHGNGIAFVFARTETRAFHDHVWPKADALLFLKGRVKFLRFDGTEADAAGAPSVLIAYGNNNADALKISGIAGHFVDLRGLNDNAARHA